MWIICEHMTYTPYAWKAKEKKNQTLEKQCNEFLLHTSAKRDSSHSIGSKKSPQSKKKPPMEEFTKKLEWIGKKSISQQTPFPVCHGICLGHSRAPTPLDIVQEHNIIFTPWMHTSSPIDVTHYSKGPECLTVKVKASFEKTELLLCWRSSIPGKDISPLTSLSFNRAMWRTWYLQAGRAATERKHLQLATVLLNIKHIQMRTLKIGVKIIPFLILTNKWAN